MDQRALCEYGRVVRTPPGAAWNSSRASPVTDGRFSGGTSGLSICHVAPEAAAGGLIALAETGDQIEIDIPHRELRLGVPDGELATRRERLLATLGGYRPTGRERPVSEALRVYAALATSASIGAVRDLG